MTTQGFFITFEGGEGCGKSSQMAMLANFFKEIKREFVITREPGGTPLSEEIRELLLSAKKGANMHPKTELLLFAAARAQHVEEFIKPAIAQGKIVICDRFFDSTSAYQGVARKLGANSVEMLNNFAAADCTPNLTILLDLDPQIGLDRASFRDAGNLDRMGSQNLEFYKAVRASFLEIAKQNSERFFVLNADDTKENIFEKIKQEIKRRFNV